MTYNSPMSDSTEQVLPDRYPRLMARLVPHALGIALGLVAALGRLLFGAAAGDAAGVFDGGALALDVLVAFVTGTVAGILVALLRNALVAAYLRFAWSRLQQHAANDVLDRVS